MLKLIFVVACILAIYKNVEVNCDAESNDSDYNNDFYDLFNVPTTKRLPSRINSPATTTRRNPSTRSSARTIKTTTPEAWNDDVKLKNCRGNSK
jgi:hypothetical protein